MLSRLIRKSTWAFGVLIAAGAGQAWAAGEACDTNNAPHVPSAADNTLTCSVTGVIDDDAEPGSTAVGSHTTVLGDSPSSDRFDPLPAGDLGGVAIGGYAAVNGDRSTAVGTGAQVGSASDFVYFIVRDGTALGSGSLVIAEGGTAVGVESSVSGVSGVAIGKSALAFGSGAVAIGGDENGDGTGAHTSGFLSTAIGGDAVANGDQATAIGAGATAELMATAVGMGASAQNEATAIGFGATADFANSVALGAGSVTDRTDSVSVGSAGSERQITNVAAGTALTDAVNVGQLNAATAGLGSDISALETTTATHTTQITSLQSEVTTLEATTATHTTQITDLQTGLAATSSDVADLQTGLASETAARIAADTAFDGRIDALEAVTANLNERFDDVEDRADAGTATAVALSGAMFLPGKSFNLTANVGAYRGAVAGAIQVGALVGESVAVNAGVAHGFSKGGKTALRAGFTLGW